MFPTFSVGGSYLNLVVGVVMVGGFLLASGVGVGLGSLLCRLTCCPRGHLLGMAKAFLCTHVGLETQARALVLSEALTQPCPPPLDGFLQTFLVEGFPGHGSHLSAFLGPPRCVAPSATRES